MAEPLDWHDWHRDYDDPESSLTARLLVVQRQIAAALDRMPSGPLVAVSVCAGQGRDLIGALAAHPRGSDVSGRLVEADARNVKAARAAARAHGLDRLQAVEADASRTDAYDGAGRADLVLLCGVLGNVSDDDAMNTIAHLPQLCSPGAAVVWTRHRDDPDPTAAIRARFLESGFEHTGFETEPSGRFAVGSERFVGEPADLTLGRRLFTFVGHDSLDRG